MKEAEKSLDPQLWHACAGGMVQMPQVNSKVFYFPQGHAEHAQVHVDFSSLPRIPALIPCRVGDVKFLADPETDEVFSKIRLVPLGNRNIGELDFEDDGVVGANGSENPEKPASFAKTLTQSDANNGGGFSVPRYCAETIFPRLDYTADPPVQTVIAKDVHGEVWKFRHIYRGTPRRHLLTTGWSTFVNQKKLVAGDSIVFLRAENGDLCVGIRRAKRGIGGALESPSGWNPGPGNSVSSYGGFSMFLREQENKVMRNSSPAGGNLSGKGKVRPESVIEAAALAASGQPFEVAYYPRASTPEFCVKASAVKATMRTQWCSGMRFKMAFETEDSSRISWFMGTIASVQVADPLRWPNSPWRLLQVTWDEPDLLQNVKRVSPWLVELVSNMPVIHISPFSPPRKKLRFPQHPDFSHDGQFPMPSFSGNPLGSSSPLCFLSDNTPAGIQGARHAQFGISLSDLHFNNKLQPGLCPSNFQRYNMNPRTSNSIMTSNTNTNENGSVRQSLVFRTTGGGGGDDGGVGGSFGGFVEKIGSSIRKSRIGLFSKSPVRALPPVPKSDDAPPIRWRRGELIGCGAFGRVYMGMNLDSGELLAVKQVSITTNSASKEKTQAHIRELEEEVKLLKNLSHPNIVRYLGTAREHDSLNILLEFVPGGSISSLLGKFGSFPESVIRMYTKQLLLGLEYLHKNGIMHRDIKGANILVDNKGCIKLADFGASKQVVELATINGAKSMKGTPYWMAPEVILQTGHSFSADIWSVGCTVIEMATGKPPWSQQYQEVAALFHIGTTKSHPPIPEHLSAEAKDFLLKCLQKEPDLRHVASDLLQHPFVTGDYWESHPISTSVMESVSNIVTPEMNLKNSLNHVIRMSTCTGLKDVCEMDSLRISTVYPQNSLNLNVRSWGLSNPDDDMCQIDDKDDLMVGASVKLKSIIVSDELNKSFNPMCEPTDDWPCKFDGSLESERSGIDLSPGQTIQNAAGSPGVPGKGENDFTFPCGPTGAEDDDEVTESKIRAFLDEKALDLKKLQTPLYEFYSTMNAAGPPGAVQMAQSENALNILNLPPKSRSPNQTPTRRLSVVHSTNNVRPGNHAKTESNASGLHDRALQEIQPPQQSEWKGLLLDAQQESFSPSDSFSERQRKWKEELDEELKRNREMMRQAGAGGKTSSPNNCILTRQRERLRFAFSGK